MTRFPQKGYAYASKESALSQRQAESPSDSEDSDVPQSTSVPGKQLRMPTPSKQASASSDDDDSDDYVSVSSSDDEDDDENVDKTSNQTPQYPILGARARKRIRPPTTYAKQMAVYIRVCLLHLRDSTKVELSDAEHAAFQEALREHRVERVIIPVKAAVEEAPVKRKKKCMIIPEKAAVEEAPVERKIKSHKTAPAESSPPAPVLEKVEKPPKKDKPKPIKTEEAKQQQPSSTTTPPAVTAATVTTTSSHNHTADDKTDTMSPADKSPVKRSAPQTSTPEEAPPKKIKVVPSAFQIPANANPKEMDRVRHQASQLQKEGIALKHDGDKKGKMDVAAQGVCYLRASAKFLEQALLLSDLKAMYKALNDSVTASKWGKDSISTLAQTANLVESTVGFFNKSGERRRVALSYKVGAIVMLASYRLQHNMLYGYYSQLHAPGRSPDGSGSSDANQDPMIQRLILKEMGALMRGFEFWRRYEACGMQDVLPDIRDPATVDMPTFFAALEAELS